MNLTLDPSPPAARMSQRPRGPSWVLRELLERHRVLTLFGIALLAAMVPTAIALGLDGRTLRGANVWVLEKLDDPLAHLRIRQELQGEGFLVRARVLEKLDGPLAHLSIGQ